MRLILPNLIQWLWFFFYFVLHFSFIRCALVQLLLISMVRAWSLLFAQFFTIFGNAVKGSFHTIASDLRHHIPKCVRMLMVVLFFAARSRSNMNKEFNSYNLNTISVDDDRRCVHGRVDINHFAYMDIAKGSVCNSRILISNLNNRIHATKTSQNFLWLAFFA